jgi:hypothetical protein
MLALQHCRLLAPNMAMLALQHCRLLAPDMADNAGLAALSFVSSKHGLNMEVADLPVETPSPAQYAILVHVKIEIKATLYGRVLNDGKG